jgi:hypothetical protein
MSANAPAHIVITSPEYAEWMRRRAPDWAGLGKRPASQPTPEAAPEPRASWRWGEYFVRSPQGETIHHTSLADAAKAMGMQRQGLGKQIRASGGVYRTKSGWAIVRKMGTA